MKVLIIGGTGLISTAVTRLLVDRGEDVTVYNRGIREERLPENVERIVGDRKDFDRFESQMKDAGKFDCVIDMICFAPEDAESAIRAFRGRTEQYIFCSTTEVFKKKDNIYPVRADGERKPTPSFPYAFKKCKCEDAFLEAHKRGDLNLTIMRPAYTYGKGTIIHTFGWATYYLDRLQKGLPIIVHGDGTSIMVASHRDDVAVAFAGAAGNKKALGRMYNVTGDEWMTWDYYHQGVAAGMGAPQPKLIHIPSEVLGKLAPTETMMCVENLQYCSLYDNTPAKEDLGFRYRVRWREGAGRTVAAIRESGGFEDCGKYPFYDRIIDIWEKIQAEIESKAPA